ncbi:hypothetical protein ACFE04_014461 [Oxalis oulophora]
MKSSIPQEILNPQIPRLSNMSTSTETLVHFYSRRLLLDTPNHQDTTHEYYSGNNTFDSNVIMILSVLLCAIICSLVLNYIIRCVLRCSRFISSQSNDDDNTVKLGADTGVQKKALKMFPIVKYSADEMKQLPGLDAECVICLNEFTVGERIRLLPKCNHGFHKRCIDKWLTSHSSCPKCRQCLIETCQKIIDSSSEYPPTVQEIIVNIEPLEPEGLICNYRN